MLNKLYEGVSDWVDEGSAVDVINLEFEKAIEKVATYHL